MTTQISGDTGIDKVQDGIINTAALAVGAVTPVKTQAGALPSMVRVGQANGYGSSAGATRRFLAVYESQGTDITHTSDAVLGDSFTINVSAQYAISYTAQFGSASWFGITKNYGAAINSAPGVNVLASGYASSTGNTSQNCAWAGYLAAGTVIRACTDGGAAGGSANHDHFTIARMGA